MADVLKKTIKGIIHGRVLSTTGAAIGGAALVSPEVQNAILILVTWAASWLVEVIMSNMSKRGLV